jgi:uncharacterized protein YdeI (YjbR/CyaY-like superfamily)
MEKNKPVLHFFALYGDWRRWLAKHHTSRSELLVGFYRLGSGKASMTWSQSIDEALCFGWIDGVRRSVDDISYSIRFTPRKAASIWSLVNCKKAEDLICTDKMQSAGLEAYKRRSEKKSGIYSHESKVQVLDSAQEKKLKSNKVAWTFFQLQAPTYKRAAIHWVAQAKQEATRNRRLEMLILDSTQGCRLKHLTSTNKPKQP